MLSADQYRTGYIHLSKTGQRKFERYDDVIVAEEPELLPSAMAALEQAYPGAVHRIGAEAGFEDDMFESVAGLGLPKGSEQDPTNLISIARR